MTTDKKPKIMQTSELSELVIALISSKPARTEKTIETNGRLRRFITDYSDLHAELIELALVLDRFPDVIKEFFNLFPTGLDMVDEILTVNENSADGAVEQRLIFEFSNRLIDWLAAVRATVTADSIIVKQVVHSGND